MATKEYSCVKRTKKAFETSLAELAKEYPLNKVTVKMLCEKAQLSRNAFYFHYSDINDLINEIEKNTIAEAEKLMEDFEKLGFPENILATVTGLIDLFDERRDTALMLMDKAYSISFTDTLGNIFGEFNYKYYVMFNKNPNRDIYNAYYAFISNGFYGTLKHWIYNPNSITKRELIRLTYTLVKRLIVPGDPDIKEYTNAENRE